jgi:hypothetical protein
MSIIGIIFIFKNQQSQHVWNNAWYSNTDWYPTSGKTLINASFIQHLNWIYIENEYGSFKNNDFFFTNKEIFGDADNIIDAIAYNPKLVIENTIKNILVIFNKIIKQTNFSSFINEHIKSPMSIVLSLMIIIGAFCYTKDTNIIIFITVLLIITFSSIIVIPKDRYLHTLIPIIFFSILFYSRLISKLLFSKFQNKTLILSLLILLLCVFVFIIFFKSISVQILLF